MKNRETGSILIAVAVLSLVMMIVSLSVISISTSQAISNQHQIDRIKAEQLAKGAWWFEYSNQLAGTSGTLNQEIIDGKTYNISVSLTGSGSGSNSTDSYSVQISY